MWAVPNKVIFCGSLMLITLGIFSLCFCSPLLMSPRAPITTGIVSVFIPHILVVCCAIIIIIIVVVVIFVAPIIIFSIAVKTSVCYIQMQHRVHSIASEYCKVKLEQKIIKIRK